MKDNILSQADSMSTTNGLHALTQCTYCRLYKHIYEYYGDINMAMSDCIHCWDAPCMCGHRYRNWNKETRIKLASAVIGIDVIQFEKLIKWVIKEEHPMKGR